MVCCFPVKIGAASEGWTRALAIVEQVAASALP
jgi:hypothetical protein